MLKKFALLGLTSLVLAACGGGADSGAAASQAQPETKVSGSLIERINNKGKIVVGTEGTYAPFTYHDQSGKLTGYDVEVARAVAQKLGVEIEFKETQWDAMLAGLKAGRFDMVANQVSLTTPERRATFDKSENYSWSGPMMLVRADNKTIKSLDDIKGLKAAQSLTSNFGENPRRLHTQRFAGAVGLSEEKSRFRPENRLESGRGRQTRFRPDFEQGQYRSAGKNQRRHRRAAERRHAEETRRRVFR